MEPNHEAEVSDDEWGTPHQWQVIDDTIVLIGLLLVQSTLFKSGYTAEVITEIQERLNKLIRYYEKKGL